MPNFVKPLRDEISRLAKKEIAQYLGQMKKSIASVKAENKSLKKEIAELKKTAQVLKKNVPHADVAVSCSDEELRTARFTPAIIIRLRKKFGLSRLKMAALLDINNKSIARWEEGIGEPKSNSRAKLLALRKMSKRDIKKHLQDLKAAKKVETTSAKKATKPAAKKAVKKTVKPVTKKTVVKKAAKKIQKKTVKAAAPVAAPITENSGNTTK